MEGAIEVAHALDDDEDEDTDDNPDRVTIDVGASTC